MKNQSALFGITRSNRDFTKKDTWGKNQFNTSFPASLACYLYSKNIKAVYLKSNGNSTVIHDELGIDDLFGIPPLSKNIFFAFETIYTPYQYLVVGSLKGIDLVIKDKKTGKSIRGLEIKLTALPDNTTCNLPESKYGTEIVIRPDTIVYLACNIAIEYSQKIDRLRKIILKPIFSNVGNWATAKVVIPYIPDMSKVINDIIVDLLPQQKPFILQPIWKTKGKTSEFADNCLDIFVWSDLAFTELILDVKVAGIKNINRQVRTIIWLFKMLYDFAQNGKFDDPKIIDELSYNTKNDKAFANSGVVTHPFMACDRLAKPVIKKTEIKNIVLGGGQELLSPERRFDSFLFYSPELFS